MSEIVIIGSDGRELSPWQAQQLVADLVESALALDAAELRVLIARTVKREINRRRGRILDLDE